jgi:hypothetical protein
VPSPEPSADFRDKVPSVRHEHDAVEQGLRDDRNNRVFAMTPDRFDPGVDDVVILPLVFIALAAKKLLQAAISILVHLLDYAFPILLQAMRFPLFTVRILGDGIAALLKAVAGYLPVSGTRRDAFHAFVNRHWSWLRQKISYQAFEEAVHHAFEAGMAWVFRTCRMLTPLSALLVIVGAVIWFPVSVVAATAMHAVLIAKAAVLPAWMQLLHPVATVIAKSKLLVLPAYPAAWPQAKRHPLVQRMFQVYRDVTGMGVIRKAGYRYRQMERAGAAAADDLRRAASRVGLDKAFNASLSGLKYASARIGGTSRAVASRMVERFSTVPFIGPIVGSYAAHYTSAEEQGPERLSEQVGSFFERWSIKFSAEYYEAKEADAATRQPQPGPEPAGLR